MWIGTDRGLWEYDVSGDKGSLYTTEHGLIHNYINSVLVREGEIWIGTQDGIGIYHRDTSAWRSIGVSEGLPSRNVKCLISDPERSGIWIGTTGGLAKYDTQTGELESMAGGPRYSITSIVRLRQPPESPFDKGDDALWLGTTSGIVEYHVSSGSHREYRALVTSGSATGQLHIMAP
jgi:ligand-binding sensor domain-containing protein